MKRKSGYLQRESEMQYHLFNAGIDFGLQLASDCWQIVLNDSDVMGKSVIGGNRMEKIFIAVNDAVHTYYDAANIKNPEADVLREKVDIKLRKIWKEKAVPFEERYTMLKKCRY